MVAFSLPVVFGLPTALCLPVDIRLFTLLRDKIDGWYSPADAAGTDDDCVPLLLVVIDDDVDARLGALRLRGSERVTGAWIDLWSPFGGCVDWQIDSPIALVWVVPTAKPSIAVSEL
ncbi:hypothetical protein PENSOL_c124G05562 [Penicillium solitum]|uniref:Heterokaryon incompatibility domain-containing protein n=1 Tax=Penicillium solitum TaxID=60172 RepID=A0A1V6Q5D3_9EURO|nr:uncharacterized protein PENSOL_c124G05562 [Penicillium solitum]OQD84455.1 hypothetical protein PENSOL_c124G05562 [Penicillium solitum]